MVWCLLMMVRMFFGSDFVGRGREVEKGSWLEESGL